MPSDTKWTPPKWPGADEMTRLMGGFKLPAAANVEALTQAYQRNMEAFAAANRIALEGAQAVAKRHMEITQQTIGELTEALRAMAGTAVPQDRAAQQADLLKSAYERAVTNTGELSELIQRANGEAIDALNRRVSEAIDEMTALTRAAGKT